MNKVNKLIFHTFNTLKQKTLKSARSKVHDPTVFIETFRRAYGVQTLCCNEVCFVLSLTAGALASKSVRFLFHSFTESFELILNYLVKPDNFNRTMNGLMFEGLERKVEEQYDRIKSLEAQLAKAMEGVTKEKLSTDHTKSQVQETEEEYTKDEATTKPITKEDEDLKLTTGEVNRINELVAEIENGKSLTFHRSTDHRILLGFNDRIIFSMQEDSRLMQKSLNEVLGHLDDLRIQPARAHFDLANLHDSLLSRNEKMPDLMQLAPEYGERKTSAHITEPLIKNVLSSVDGKSREVAVRSDHSGRSHRVL